MKAGLVQSMKSSKEFFDRATRCLEEEHSAFAPVDGMYSVAQHVAHVGLTVDWFVEGASRPEGFDLDFDAHETSARKVTSLREARAILDRAFDGIVKFIESQSDEALTSPLPEGPVMGGAPRLAIVSAIDDHTAHHRGALGVYARLLGLKPAMPYMEMEEA